MKRLYKKPFQSSKESNKIEMLFLDTSYTRKGYAKKLLNQAISELHVEYVDVNEQNPNAVAFYKAMGFCQYTFALWLVQRGVNLYSVKELMGHSDFKMTQRYSHLSPNGLRKAAMLIHE